MPDAPSPREIERREQQSKQARAQQQTGRVIFGETPEVDLPKIGRVALRFRNPDLALAERRLTPLLDELPDHLAGFENADGVWQRYANVWDALETLGTRFPMDTIGVLLYAAVRHAGITETQVDDLPPSIFRDPNLETALGTAIAIAFGATGEEDDPTAGPTVADA